MSRTGRPKSDNPKSHTVAVRLDVKYDELLTKYANNHNVRKAVVARRIIEAFLDKEENK